MEKCTRAVFSLRGQTIMVRNNKKLTPLEIFCRSVSFSFDLRSTVKVPQVTQCQGLYMYYVDLTISTDSFRTNVVAGKILPPRAS